MVPLPPFSATTVPFTPDTADSRNLPPIYHFLSHLLRPRELQSGVQSSPTAALSSSERVICSAATLRRRRREARMGDESCTSQRTQRKKVELTKYPHRKGAERASESS